MLNEMLNFKIHLGDKSFLKNEKMKNFILMKKNKFHIIDLKKTIILYKKALIFIRKLAMKSGKILFVGTKPFMRKIIEKISLTTPNSSYVNYRWIGGTLTNFKTINNLIKKLKYKEERIKFNKYYNKKELSIFNKNIEKLKKNIDGFKNMNKLPDAIIIIDSKIHKNAVKEAKKLNIPIVGLLDTNNNPDNINYIIPINTSLSKSILFILNGISKEYNNFLVL